jgi:transferase hexapeptide repeat containing protein
MYRNIIKPVLDFLTTLIAFIVLSPIFVNAFINAKAKVGKHCVINTKANIEHNV